MTVQYCLLQKPILGLKFYYMEPKTLIYALNEFKVTSLKIILIIDTIFIIISIFLIIKIQGFVARQPYL